MTLQFLTLRDSVADPLLKPSFRSNHLKILRGASLVAFARQAFPEEISFRKDAGRREHIIVWLRTPNQ
jgi:hypothetical protein